MSPSTPELGPVIAVDWTAFCVRWFEDLWEYARSRCRAFGLPQQDAEELLQDAIVDCMSAVIRGDPEHAPIAYVRRAVRNKALDRATHGWHPRRVGPEGEGDAPGTAREREPSDPDERREALAILEARDHLHRHVPRPSPLDRAHLDAALAAGLDARSTAAYARSVDATPGQVAKWAERGRYLLEGWLHALCGTRPPEPDWSPARTALWRRGLKAGGAYRRGERGADSEPQGWTR